MSSNFQNSVGPRTRKCVFIPFPKKGNAKECLNYRVIVLISNASKVMLKILQAKLQQYMNQEFPDVQAGFRKGRGTRDKIAIGSQRKQGNSSRTSISASLTMLKPLSLWITKICGKLLVLGIPDHPEKPVFKIRTWNNRLVKNYEKSSPRLYIVTLPI